METAGRFPALERIDCERLTELVRRALSSDIAEIVDWNAKQIEFAHFNPTSKGIYRFWGTAQVGGATPSWSLVLKVVHAPPDHDSEMSGAAHAPTDWNYWKREVQALRSGFFETLPPGIAAPRCYGVSEQDDGSVWLWLEEVVENYGSRWDSPQYAVAAYQLGQFNGAYLAGRPIPQYDWLSEGVLRGWVESFGPAIAGLDSALNHPLVQRGFSAANAARLARLWAERNHLFGGLERLPKTLCHLDADRDNLFVRRAAADGGDQTVAIDWALMGTESVGVELASLVTWSAAMVAGDVGNLRELDQVVFANYLNGLRSAGWDANERLVRFGYTASVALRMGTLLGAYWGTVNLDDPQTFAQAMFHCSIGELMDRVAVALSFVLDLADEARAAG